MIVGFHTVTNARVSIVKNSAGGQIKVPASLTLSMAGGILVAKKRLYDLYRVVTELDGVAELAVVAQLCTYKSSAGCCC
jgi:hypothetical protein